MKDEKTTNTVTPAANATVFDPFADFVAARPVNQAVPQLINNQPSFFPLSTAPTAAPTQITPQNFFQDIQPSMHSFPPAQSIPPPASNDFFSTANQPPQPPQPMPGISNNAFSSSSSYLISSAFNPPPPEPADKYAALAELDRLEKASAEKPLHQQQQSLSASSFAQVAPSMAFGAVPMVQKNTRNPFGSGGGGVSTYNPFQTTANMPGPDVGNPFAMSMGSNKNAVSAGTAPTMPLGQNSFNPFIVSWLSSSSH